MDLRSFSCISAKRALCAGLFPLLFSALVGSYASSLKEATNLSDAAQPQSTTIPCTSAANAPVRKVSGIVSDPSGAHIQNAHLTLSCGNFQLTASTNSDGAYSFSVPAGSYRLLVEAQNFSSASQAIAVADAETGTERNITLSLGQVRNSVMVTAGSDYTVTEGTGGTKTELSFLETPQAITVVNRKLMDVQNVVKLDDALKNVAGVAAGGYYDGWDYYRIRGFDASFNTYIDGLRGGNGMMEETWGLESVEVLKGPSSALYGQSTLGGLVNIVTRKPVPETFAKFQMTAGSFSFVDPAVDMGGSLNRSRTVYARLAALYHSADSYVDYAYRHRYYFAPSLTWRPSSATSLTLIGRFQRDNGRQSMPLPAVGTVLPNPNGPISIHLYNGELGQDSNKSSQANQQFGYQFQQQLGKYITLRQNARFAWYQQKWNRIYYPSSLEDDKRTLLRYPLSYDGPWQTHTIDTNLGGHAQFWNMEHSALIGFEFFRNPSKAVGSLGGTEPLDLYHPVYGANPVGQLFEYTNTKTVTQYSGVYLQDHIRFQKNVTLTAGGRVDFAKNESKGTPNQNGNGFTPRIGLTWQFIPQSSLYASFSKSYLPQSGQVRIDENTSTFVSPERGQQWETGLKSGFWGGRISTTVALFQLNRKNVATANPNYPNFYLVTGEQRSRGIEFETTLHPLAGWNITSSYSYIDAKVVKDSTLKAGTPTLNAPKNLFNIWTNYEIPRGFARGVGLGIGGRHYSEQSGDLENKFQLPEYGIVDMTVSYNRGPLHWQLNANNISNKRYFIGSYNDLYVKPGEPRVIRSTVSWNF